MSFSASGALSTLMGAYSALSVTERYDVARLIGKLNKQISDRKAFHPAHGARQVGTTSPSLGVPVRVLRDQQHSVMVEVEYATGSSFPSCRSERTSPGSRGNRHLLLLLFSWKERRRFLMTPGWRDSRNLLPTLVPDAARYASVVRVYERWERSALPHGRHRLSNSALLHGIED